MGSCQFRVNGQGKVQFLAEIVNFRRILRIPDPGDGMAVSSLFGNQAAEHIQLIGVCGGNQKISLLNTCFDLCLEDCSVSGHRHHIDAVCDCPEDVGIPVNQYNVMIFTVQLFCQGNTYLAAAHNNNFHTQFSFASSSRPRSAASCS